MACGFGDLVKNGKIVTPRDEFEGVFGMPMWIRPSTRHQIPSDVTHILWYNR